MKLDRRGYFSRLDKWRRLLAGAGLQPEVKGYYELRILGLKGYHMVSNSAQRAGVGDVRDRNDQ